MKLCPCGSRKEFKGCCERFISGQQPPGTPEELMRSRYTAYSTANMAYIAQTMKAPASKNFDANTAEQWTRKVSWQGLTIIRSTMEQNTGIVEFIAYYSENEHPQQLHEVSQFERVDGKWYYIDGITRQTKVGRNELCPCGSQKKYKKCCGLLS